MTHALLLGQRLFRPSECCQKSLGEKRRSAQQPGDSSYTIHYKATEQHGRMVPASWGQWINADPGCGHNGTTISLRENESSIVSTVKLGNGVSYRIEKHIWYHLSQAIYCIHFESEHQRWGIISRRQDPSPMFKFCFLF